MNRQRKYRIPGVCLLFSAVVIFSASSEASGKKWPFAEWSYAKAYTYNFFKTRYFPRIQYRVYSGKNGWNRTIHSSKPISQRQAMKVSKWVNRSRGTVMVSKCPFPRHAVVFFNKHDMPVGSASVCFQCGDLMTWPEYPEPKSDKIAKQHYDKQYKTYKKLFPKWKKFFTKELGFPNPFSQKSERLFE